MKCCIITSCNLGIVVLVTMYVRHELLACVVIWLLLHIISFIVFLFTHRKQLFSVTLLFITCVCCITELKPPHNIAKLKLYIRELPKRNYQTLKMLFNHLRK